MPFYYFDSSAIVKRYVDEPGSTWVRQLCQARDTETDEKLNFITIGEIAVAEVAAAFAILVRRNVLSKKAGERNYRKFMDEFRSEYKLAPVTSAIILSAAALTQSHPLKAYDAIQLAVALRSNDLLKKDDLFLTFVTADKTLLQAAEAEELAAENPQDHT